jgi:hypothetical protein
VIFLCDLGIRECGGIGGQLTGNSRGYAGITFKLTGNNRGYAGITFKRANSLRRL